MKLLLALTGMIVVFAFSAGAGFAQLLSVNPGDGFARTARELRTARLRGAHMGGHEGNTRGARIALPGRKQKAGTSGPFSMELGGFTPRFVELQATDLGQNLGRDAPAALRRLRGRA